MGGYLTGTDGWFNNAGSQVSAHFGVGLNGEIHQYVKLEDGAWANGFLEAGNTWPGPRGVNPNYLTVGIETEDRKNGLEVHDVPDAEYKSTLACCRVILEDYPMIHYLVGHNVISPSSRAHCPGDRWTDTGRFTQLATELGLEAMP